MRLLSLALSFACLAGLTACRRQATSEAKVRQFSEDFVHNSLAFAPIQATAVGYHRHAGTNLDELLNDYSESGLARANTFYDHSLGDVAHLTDSRLPAESQADLEMIRQQCERRLFQLNKLQASRHNPAMYVENIGNALYTPFIIGYAPEAERFADITARLQKIPAFLTTAQHNLEDSPLLWNQVAQQENEGNITLIYKTIRDKVPADGKARFNTAATSAIAALRSFNTFLKEDLSHRQSGWRLGPANYAAKFRLTFAGGTTPEQLLSDAESKLKAIRQDMHRRAKALYGKYYPGQSVPPDENVVVSQVLAKIAEQHAAPADYLDAARADLAEATAFIEAHHLLSLPGKSTLQVIPTPVFMRGLYGVGGFSPAPALQPSLGSFYWITPFTPQMAPERIESKLREYNRYGLQLLTVHEAMPGHYVQFEYADRVQPESRRVLRAVFSDTPYVEGWAVHATEMMIDAGYQQSPEMQLTWEKHLLRVVSNSILDIKLQTQDMTDRQALDLMENQTFQEKEEAELKLRRAKLSSCQLPTYFVGWRAWDRLQEEVQRTAGSGFRLNRFNEEALNEGAVPMPLLRRMMLSRNGKTASATK